MGAAYSSGLLFLKMLLQMSLAFVTEPDLPLSHCASFWTSFLPAEMPYGSCPGFPEFTSSVKYVCIGIRLTVASKMDVHCLARQTLSTALFF